MSVAWLLVLGCRDPAVIPEVTPPPPRHALIIVLDTTRDDVVTQAETPNIDRLASAGVRVEQAWSPGTWTVPSVVSLFTGMSVREHGWDLPAARLGKYPMLPEAPTIATVLQRAGFGTDGLYANPYLAEELGFDRGFESFTRSTDATIVRRFQEDVIPKWSDGRRHLAYVHALGPHTPLRPSPQARARHPIAEHWYDPKMGFDIGRAKRNQEPGVRDAYGEAYRAAVEDADHLVGGLVDALGEHRDDTLVIVTSDHGELLGEHGVCEHGKWVWQALTHVPLVIDRPMTLPPSLSLTSLPAIVTRALEVPHGWPTPIDVEGPALIAQREGKLAISDGRWKAIWDATATPALQVFDLQTDPGEHQPLPARPELEAWRTTWEASTPAGLTTMESVALSPETVKALEALGYVGE